jgi:hypothetical protein
LRRQTGILVDVHPGTFGAAVDRCRNHSFPVLPWMNNLDSFHRLGHTPRLKGWKPLVKADVFLIPSILRAGLLKQCLHNAKSASE